MSLKLRFFYFVLPSLLLKCTAAFPVAATDFMGSLRVRVRRQDGYVYNKPSVSFDLPQSSTPAPTQAPNVDRTLAQQMYYAYPAPAGGGDTVNIGQTVGTTATAATAATAAPTAAGGYNYRSSTGGNTGYNYGTASAGAQANTGSQVINTGSQAAANTGTSRGSSGYGSNAPSPTLSPTLQGSSEVSTSAPKYLPPTSGIGGNAATGGSLSVGGVSITSGSGQVTTSGSTSAQTGSIETPSDTYLPPLGTSNTATSGQTVTSTGLVSIPSSSYLPPNTPSLPASNPGSPSPQPAPVQPASYIPPTGPNSGTVSTPASTYLPPSFF